MAKSYPVPVEKVDMGGKRMYRRISLSLEFSPEDWRVFRVYCGELYNGLDGLDDGSVWSEAASNAVAAGVRIALGRVLSERR